MNRSIISKVAIAGLLVLSPSCSFATMADRPARVSDLVDWVERVHVESELAKQKMRTATTLLATIAERKYAGTSIEAFKQFVTALEESEAQATALRNAIAPMKTSAIAVFQQWEADLDKITSSAIRMRSTERRTSTEKRYNDVVAAVDPAQASFDALNRALRDHALFLGNDLNPASVALIKEDVAQLKRAVEELDGRFGTCLKAAQDYVNAYALPVPVAPSATPGPEGTGPSKR